MSKMQVDLSHWNEKGEVALTPHGIHLYNGLPINVIKARPRSKDAKLFYQALFIRHSVGCEFDAASENANLNSIAPTITTGSVSVKLTLKGTSSFDKISPSEGETIPDQIRRLFTSFEPHSDYKELFDIAKPLAVDCDGNLDCEIVFPCDMTVMSYGNEELLTSDR